MKRWMIQLGTTIFYNANLSNFFKGSISTLPTKNICVPGLNCYSCPGAIGSCPIGALQAVAGDARYKLSLYVLGTLVMFGTLFGRFTCGYLCPFGFFQDLLFKIKSKKYRLFKYLKWVKYGVLIYFVMLLPAFLVNEYGLGDPAFCKYLCPSGTLFAAIPLLIANPSLRTLIGTLFNLKVAILLSVIVLSVFIYRFFCKVLCPLGAFYAPFNKVSFYQFKINNNCIDCGICEKVCQMDINPSKSPNNLECIRCNKCVEACPVNAIEKIKHLQKPVKII